MSRRVNYGANTARNRHILVTYLLTYTQKQKIVSRVFQNGKRNLLTELSTEDLSQAADSFPADKMSTVIRPESSNNCLSHSLPSLTLVFH
jgi:hypothetical protein